MLAFSFQGSWIVEEPAISCLLQEKKKKKKIIKVSSTHSPKLCKKHAEPAY